MSSYSIAHFSDFHLSDSNVELARAVNLVRDAIGQGVDHIAITGDVVETAQFSVFQRFWDRLCKLGWTSAEKMSFAPGNHDIFPASKRPPFCGAGRPSATHARLCSLTRFSRTGRAVKMVGDPYPVGKLLSPHVVLAALDTTRNGQYPNNKSNAQFTCS